MRTDTKEKRQQKRHKNPLTEKIGGRSMIDLFKWFYTYSSSGSPQQHSSDSASSSNFNCSRNSS